MPAGRAGESGIFDAPVYALARQFRAADAVVVAAPFWDLSYPAALRTYIEYISAVGLTYHYDEDGCHGGCEAGVAGVPHQRRRREREDSVGVLHWRQLAAMFGIPQFDYVFAGGLDASPDTDGETLAAACGLAEKPGQNAVRTGRRAPMAPKIVCVAGPTACGKTTLGVLLAQKFNGEVVSVDSMQIYRGMTVGTAAPTEEEMQGIPHHMIAVADPTEQWSAAEYAARATAAVDSILARGKLPILVGGTGLWMDALIRGHGFAKGHAGGAVRRELEARFEQEGIEPLLAELRQVDPESAARLHPADTKRILRALEVYRETGETISAHNAATRQLPPRYDAVWIGLQFADRADMKALIDRRVDKMAEAGLLDEVRSLLAMGLPRNATAMQAIGYKEFLGVLDGTLTEQEALELVKLRSRQYAKRQLTWLRKNPAIHWIYWEKERDFARALQISTEILTASGLG